MLLASTISWTKQTATRAGALNVSNTAGAALWAFYYGLFASQIGISRVHFHEGIGYKYSFVRIASPFFHLLINHRFFYM
jgi:hypothetical protein